MRKANRQVTRLCAQKCLVKIDLNAKKPGTWRTPCSIASGCQTNIKTAPVSSIKGAANLEEQNVKLNNRVLLIFSDRSVSDRGPIKI
jgi:hypothetical protein